MWLLSLFPGPHPTNPLVLYRTASNGKLGEGLGTRLMAATVLATEPDFHACKCSHVHLVYYKLRAVTEV